MDLEKKISTAIQLIRELPDPFAWATSFKDSWRRYRGDAEIRALAADCQDLSDALYRLEVDPSSFLYDIVPGKSLPNLTDEELADPAVRAKIVAEVAPFQALFDEVLQAFSRIEPRAYRKLGEVIVDLRKGLDQRRKLLATLSSVVTDGREPAEIRALGEAYFPLIDSIEPLREAIRRFVEENR